MKKYLLLLALGMMSFSSTFAAVEDTSIIDELNGGSITKTQDDFKLKKFSSCENIENIMNKYLQDYYKNNPPPVYYNRG
jgi:hypothetical protein